MFQDPLVTRVSQTSPGSPKSHIIHIDLYTFVQLGYKLRIVLDQGKIFEIEVWET